MKIYIITIDESILTGCNPNKIIVGCYKKKPTLKILEMWAKEYECNSEDFNIEESFLK